MLILRRTFLGHIPSQDIAQPGSNQRTRLQVCAHGAPDSRKRLHRVWSAAPGSVHQLCASWVLPRKDQEPRASFRRRAAIRHRPPILLGSSQISVTNDLSIGNPSGEEGCSGYCPPAFWTRCVCDKRKMSRRSAGTPASSCTCTIRVAGTPEAVSEVEAAASCTGATAASRW